MTKDLTQHHRASVSPHVALLIDLMGHADTLRKWTTDHAGRVLSPEIEEKFCKSAQSVCDVRKIMKVSFAAAATCSTSENEIQTLPKDFQTAYREWGGSQMTVQTFSDTIVGFTSIMRPTGNVIIRDVCAAINAGAVAFLACLATGHVIRGSIEVGYATDTFKGELFGPLLLDVYELERDTADYPRIIVGSELRKLLVEARSVSPRGPLEILNKEAAIEATQAIRLEPDGSWSIDYLADTFRTSARASDQPSSMQRMFPQALEFVRQETDRMVTLARNAQGPAGQLHKIARQLSTLRAYFDGRADVWLQPK